MTNPINSVQSFASNHRHPGAAATSAAAEYNDKPYQFSSVQSVASNHRPPGAAAAAAAAE